MAVVVRLGEYERLIVSARNLNHDVRPLRRRRPIVSTDKHGLPGRDRDDAQRRPVAADTARDVDADDIPVVRVRRFELATARRADCRVVYDVDIL